MEEYDLEKDSIKRELDSIPTIKRLTCLKCGHIWFPRKVKKPNVCPYCHNKDYGNPPKYKRRMKDIENA